LFVSPKKNLHCMLEYWGSVFCYALFGCEKCMKKREEILVLNTGFRCWRREKILSTSTWLRPSLLFDSVGMRFSFLRSQRDIKNKSEIINCFFLSSFFLQLEMELLVCCTCIELFQFFYFLACDNKLQNATVLMSSAFCSSWFGLIYQLSNSLLWCLISCV
jgi:hypothetical protein